MRTIFHVFCMSAFVALSAPAWAQSGSKDCNIVGGAGKSLFRGPTTTKDLCVQKCQQFATTNANRVCSYEGQAFLGSTLQEKSTCTVNLASWTKMSDRFFWEKETVCRSVGIGGFPVCNPIYKQFTRNECVTYCNHKDVYYCTWKSETIKFNPNVR